MNFWRTWLYVPANNEQRVEKALNSRADCVILDLEDAVSSQEKDRARGLAVQTLEGSPGKPVLIRINAYGSPWFASDLAALAAARMTAAFAGVRIPKVDNLSALSQAAQILGSEIPLHPLLESAQGISNLYEIASAQPSIASLSLGETDLKADLAMTLDVALDPIRVSIILACRSAGLVPPPASVFTHLDDDLGLTESTQRMKSMGFFGRSVIHPKQIATVNSVFTPTAKEVETASALLDEVTSFADTGISAFLRSDGTFVDPATVRQARDLLSLNRIIKTELEDNSP